MPRTKKVDHLPPVKPTQVRNNATRPCHRCGVKTRAGNRICFDCRFSDPMYEQLLAEVAARRATFLAS